MKKEVLNEILKSPIGGLVENILMYYLNENEDGNIDWDEMCEMVNNEIKYQIESGDYEWDRENIKDEDVVSIIWKIINGIEEEDLFVMMNE